MVNSLNIKPINKIKKLAAKGKAGLFFATLWLASIIICRKVWKYIKMPVVRFASVVMLCVVFFATSSFAPVEKAYADSFDAAHSDSDVLLDENGMLIIDELPEEQYLVTEVTDEDDVASLDDLLEHVDENEVEGESEVYEEPEEFEFDKSSWNLVLINKQHPIPSDYTFSLGTIKGSMKCDERLIEPLTQMFLAAAGDGINLEVRSPYRDMSLQEYLFDRKVKNYINQGYSYIDAYKISSEVVTLPGASEHQIGISLDITSDTYWQLNEGFADTEAGKWLMDNSYKYGFILRYPKGKEDITGIIYEPWHYRYVGVEAATVIYEQGITLEEFIDSL